MQSVILSLFKPGVILSFKTVAQGTGIKRKTVKTTLKQMEKENILKSSDPLEVGSGKNKLLLFSLK